MLAKRNQCDLWRMTLPDPKPHITSRQAETVRAAIQTKQIVNRLHAFVFGNIQLSGRQVKAAAILLAKTIPDLHAVALIDSTDEEVSSKDMYDRLWVTVGDMELDMYQHLSHETGRTILTKLVQVMPREITAEIVSGLAACEETGANLLER